MKTLILFAIGLVVLACSNSEPQTTMDNSPNSSELALLMREIHVEAKDWRLNLVNGKMLEGEVDVYADLVESVPTKPEVKGPIYEAMAKEYQVMLDSLFAANEIQLSKVQYNNVVDACLTCHATFCPGPSKTIEKLRIPGV